MTTITDDLDRLNSKNLLSESISQETWSRAEATKSLSGLFSHLNREALEAQRWYMKRKAARKRSSIFLRSAAILLALLGAIYPVLIASPIPIISKYQSVGYLAFALAASCVGADRLFCLSSGWRRYVITGLRLKELHVAFQLDWEELRAKCQDNFSTDQYILHAFKILRKFSREMDTLINSETMEFFIEYTRAELLLERHLESSTARHGNTSHKNLLLPADESNQTSPSNHDQTHRELQTTSDPSKKAS